MVFCWIIPTIIQVPATWAIVQHVARIGLKRQIAPLIPAVVGTAVMAAVVLALSHLVADQAAPVRLAVKILAGAVTYGLCLLILDQDIRRIFAQLLPQSFSSLNTSGRTSHPT